MNEILREPGGNFLTPRSPLFFKKFNGEPTDAFSYSKRVLNFKACNSKTAKVI